MLEESGSILSAEPVKGTDEASKTNIRFSNLVLKAEAI